MAFEPPSDVMRASRMRTGVSSVGKVRTGAKTATKDQERDYLDRFRTLAEDPSPLVPEWLGKGTDPYARTRAAMERVRSRQASPRWLRWYARGKRLRSAYAQTLLILEGGKIPSFASMKFRGRDVKFVLRGRGLRDKLIAVQNHDQPDVRLLGYVDLARKTKTVIVSTKDLFFAVPVRGPVPTDALAQILTANDLPVTATAESVVCSHTTGTTLHYVLPQLGVTVELCRACVKRLHEGLPHELEANVLVPDGEIRAERRIGGSDRIVHPAEARTEFEGILGAASDDALERMKSYTDVSDADLLDWAEDSVRKRLEERAGGFLLVGHDLWLADYGEAAKALGTNDLERRVIAAAFGKTPPRLVTSEPSLNRLVEPAWREHGVEILRELGGATLDPADLPSLATLRPSDALAALARHLQTEERFAAYPRLRDLAPPIRLAHDLFKAERTGDTNLFQRRLTEGVRDPALKSVALAIARAFGKSAGVEWQYAPHEKDQALFFDPACRRLSRATPETYLDDLAVLAEAAGVPAPVPQAA